MSLIHNLRRDLATLAKPAATPAAGSAASRRRVPAGRSATGQPPTHQPHEKEHPMTDQDPSETLRQAYAEIHNPTAPGTVSHAQQVHQLPPERPAPPSKQDIEDEQLAAAEGPGALTLRQYYRSVENGDEAA